MAGTNGEIWQQVGLRLKKCDSLSSCTDRAVMTHAGGLAGTTRFLLNALLLGWLRLMMVDLSRSAHSPVPPTEALPWPPILGAVFIAAQQSKTLPLTPDR